MRAWWILGGIVLAALAGCGSQWQASRPIVPASGSIPPTRVAHGSVGVLARLAVLRVDMQVEPAPAPGDQGRWQTQVEASGRQLQAQVVDYLVRQKGYEARAVDLPPVDGEEAARALARSLDVDGLVHVQRYVVPPWTTAQAIGNVFLLNVPLVRALNAVNLRISIIEGRSGEVVWRRELKGQETERDTPADIPAALGDLDNAVPRVLR